MANWDDASDEAVRFKGGQATVLVLPVHVIKTAKPETAADIAREARILEHVAGRVSAPIPHVIEKWNSFSFTMSRLEGTHLRTALMKGRVSLHHFDDLAIEIARFVREFSACFTEDQIKDLGIKPWHSNIDSLRKTKPVLLANETISSDPLLHAQVDALLTNLPHARHSQPIPVHNDLSPVNLMWPFGVIDFGVVNHTSPENAFRNLIAFPPALTFKIVEAYEKLSGQTLDKSALCGAMCAHLGVMLLRHEWDKSTYNPAPLAGHLAKIIGHYHQEPIAPIVRPHTKTAPATFEGQS